MTIYYVGVPLLTLVAVLDATFIKVLQVWGGAPNLMLMVIVSWALLTDIEEALPWAVIGGVLRDLLAMVPTGSSALAFILIVIVIDSFLPKLSWRNVVIPPLTVALATLVYDLMIVGMLAISGFSRPLWFGLTYVTLPGAVANGLLVLLVYRLIGSVNAFLRPQKVSLLE